MFNTHQNEKKKPKCFGVHWYNYMKVNCLIMFLECIVRGSVIEINKKDWMKFTPNIEK